MKSPFQLCMVRSTAPARSLCSVPLLIVSTPVPKTESQPFAPASKASTPPLRFVPPPCEFWPDRKSVPPPDFVSE